VVFPREAKSAMCIYRSSQINWVSCLTRINILVRRERDLQYYGMMFESSPANELPILGSNMTHLGYRMRTVQLRRISDFMRLVPWGAKYITRRKAILRINSRNRLATSNQYPFLSDLLFERLSRTCTLKVLCIV